MANKSNMISRVFSILIGIICASIVVDRLLVPKLVQPTVNNVWKIEAIDTMKFSRDLAREKGDDVAFEAIIKAQVRDIAKTGATHVSIGTPYDKEFEPYLRKWVQAARKEKLHVWFRGNLSGWEGWFNYPRISREEHTQELMRFIERNADLFQDGDIFSTCPECENGGPGDPRKTGDVTGHRDFLIDEYIQTHELFQRLGKNVQTNFNGMNYDVALLIMDKDTTMRLGNVIVVDHYVQTPEETVKDLAQLAQKTGGKIMLGEVGVPIPDIHGEMTETEQNIWIKELLTQLSHESYVIGINYWTGNGASTEIWNTNGTPRKAVETVKTFYTANHTNR